jgi:hypothetical protein
VSFLGSGSGLWTATQVEPLPKAQPAMDADLRSMRTLDGLTAARWDAHLQIAHLVWAPGRNEHRLELVLIEAPRLNFCVRSSQQPRGLAWLGW